MRTYIRILDQSDPEVGPLYTVQVVIDGVPYEPSVDQECTDFDNLVAAQAKAGELGHVLYLQFITVKDGEAGEPT